MEVLLEKNTNGTVLVAYASKCGSTEEIAQFIAEKLSQDIGKVELKSMDEVSSLSRYDKIIIGSPIQYDRWIPIARQFIRDNKDILSKIPTAYFFTCLELTSETERAAKKKKEYLDKLYQLAPEVQPYSIEGFAGVLNFSKMPFLTRFIGRFILGIIGVKEGDYRDWDRIESWIKTL